MNKRKLFKGKLEINRKGEFTIVSKNITHTIIINEPSLKYFDGDEVEFYISKRKRKGKYLATIEKLLKRERSRYVGIIEINENFAFEILDEKKVHVDIFIPRENIKNAKDGDKVIIEILKWRKNDLSPIGRVIKVLGRPGEHETEINTIIEQNQLPLKFPNKVTVVPAGPVIVRVYFPSLK